MRYRLLGRTGLKVSELGLGTMTFGGGKTIGGIDQATATALVDRALEAGINLLDTADVYSGTEAETMLGRALGNRRKDVIIASKVRLGTGKGPNDAGLSRAHIMDAVEGSLRRLQTDTIDLYQLHIVDSLTPLEETLRALEDLVRSGKVRYIGCCNYPAWQIMKALAISDARGWTRYATVQAHYSLAERGLEREIGPLLRDQGLGLLVWSPLSGGLLSGKFTRDGKDPKGARRTTFDFPPVDMERAFAVIDAMAEIAATHQASVAQVALAWLLQQDIVTSVILGARRVDQLEDNLQSPNVHLSLEQLARLATASALAPEYPGWMLAEPWDDRM
jgi:aryl-alcohol dehydrogenase-like predicted oxidoreductase